MRALLITALLVFGSTAGYAQEWHPVASSFCSQIKAKGAKVSYRPFLIFAASDVDTKCCEGLTLKARGRTEEFGHFRVLDLERGRYFLSFDLKTKQVIVPILVEHIVDRRYIGRDCDPTSRLTVDKDNNRLNWEEWVILD